jgi:DNA-binding CsgD family transcriptional regulator
VRIIQFHSGAVKDKSAKDQEGLAKTRDHLSLDASLVAALRSRARRSTKSYRWNHRVLVAAYLVLAASIMVSIETNRSEIVAFIALPGLVGIWIFGVLQAKKADDNALRDLVDEYKELLELQKNTTVESSQHEERPVNSTSPLSDREVEVLTRIAQGDSNKQAALALFISEQTVKNHLKHIYTKLGVNDRTSAILTAIGHGWIDKSRGSPRGDLGPEALQGEPLE